MVLRLSLCLTLIAVTILGFEIGKTAGEHNSGLYDPDKTALLYVAAHARPYVLGKESGLYIDVGWHRYVFVYDTFQVHSMAVLKLAQNYNPRRAWTVDEVKNMKDIIGISPLIQGGLGAVLIKAVLKNDEDADKKGINKVELAILTVATAGSAYVGYRVGHKSQIDLDDPRFVASLAEQNTWLPLYALFRKCDRQSLAAINMDEVKRMTVEGSCAAVERRVVRL